MCMSGLWFPHHGKTLLLKNFNLRKLSHKEAEVQVHKIVKRLRVCLWTEGKGKLQFRVAAYCVYFYIIKLSLLSMRRNLELKEKLINVCSTGKPCC